jgi:hypothetical protein
MATVNKSFDVKINIVRPYITKNISEADFAKISQTASLKYETLKTTAPENTLSTSELSDEEGAGNLSVLSKRLDKLCENFEDLMERAERSLKEIVFTYDPSSPENELIANSERDIFGSASGVITFGKYKKILDFEEILNRELLERMIENNGVLDVA